MTLPRTPSPPPASDPRAGALYAVAAFGAWGFVPIYFKAVASVPALEVLVHRIVWSVVLLACVVSLRGRWAELRAGLHPRAVWMVLAGAILVAGNWLTFIYGVATDRVVECSLGYFINPLVNVLLGVVVLGERLRRRQLWAVAIATAAVVNLTIAQGQLPWIALVLAFSFGLYGLVRKTAPLGSLHGLTLETLFLLPAALALVFLWSLQGRSHFGSGWSISLLLAAGGVVTALPLLWFVEACRRLRLVTVGFFQYLAPSFQLLLGVLAYGESFGGARAISFAGIWAALAIYSWDSVRSVRRA